MSWRDGKMLGFDLETTGTDPYEARPVSFALVEFEQGQVGKGRHGLVQPGVPIPPEATEVHGITDAMVAERGGDLLRTVTGLVEVLCDASAQGTPLVTMNGRYDLCVLNVLSLELGLPTLTEAGWSGPVLDALVLDRMVDRFRKGARTLSALCGVYGIEHARAHDATADVIAAYRVVQAIAALHPEVREADLDDVYRSQAVAHLEWAKSFSEYRVKKGDPPLDDTEYGWPLPEDRDEVEAMAAPNNVGPHVGEPGGGHKDYPVDDPDGLLVSRGQQTSVILRFKELGISDRTERLWIITQVTGRPVGSSKDLTEPEYRELVAYLGTPAGALLAQEARTAVAQGWAPPGASKPSAAPTAASPPEEHPEWEPFEDVDVGKADRETIRSTMKLVMHMPDNEVKPLLKQFGLPQTGKVNDRRLRLYSWLCQERAKGNAEAEAVFA